MDRLTYWQRRARDAERRVKVEQEHNENTRQWALKAFDEQKRLSERCEFLYGCAMALGAEHSDLRQP